MKRFIFRGLVLRRPASLALMVCAVLFAAQAGRAQVMPPTTLPAITIGTAALISPTQGSTFYGSATLATDGLKAITHSATATPVPPEIAELARALKNNPDLIYEFVHNNIEVTWMYGLQKGALGALIDKSGTPFDQAALMVALLTQAGYNAGYKSGTVALSGGDFTAWTGITDANAACQMLANGGFPAIVNSTTTTACSGVAGGTIGTVTMAHVWVWVTIGGTDYLFDPSRKNYTWYSGINLATATGLTPGAPLAQAVSGMTSGTDVSGAPYIRQLNGSGLNTTLSGYAQSLLNYLYSAGLTAKHLQEITGGGILQPFVSPPGGQRLTTLTYATPAITWSCTAGQWPCTVPDQYRTTLTVSGTVWNGQTSTVDALFNVAFFADEIYGRRLVVTTDFARNKIGAGSHYYENKIGLELDGVELATHTNPSPVPAAHLTARGEPTQLTLAVNHPYAASANNVVGIAGDYMDATVTKPVILITSLAVVAGFGDSSAALFKKWSDELNADSLQPPPIQIPNDCVGGTEPCTTYFYGTTGDFGRQKTAANWLAQYTRAAHLHADIAGSVVQLHHALGFVYSDSHLSTSYRHTPPVVGDLPISTVADSFDRLDVDSAFSLSSRTANATARRAAILAFASTAAALEGSIAAQESDLPDTASTAARFEWANTPPGTTGSPDPAYQDPSGVGPRRFYQFNAANAAAASGILVAEGHAPPTACSTTDPWTSQPSLCGDFIGPLAAEIAAYTAAGFTVSTSQEAFLGPGQRGGAIKPSSSGSAYSHLATKQRGGALVATRLDGNGDPLQIAHSVLGIGVTGIGTITTKGGGGGNQPDQQTRYAPAEPADILKSHFVDKSNVLGVNLANGTPSSTSPASLSLGTGGFPYELSASLTWRAGVSTSAGLPLTPVVPTQPQAGWTSSWANNLAISGSGLEGMGESDIREAVGAIAAFYAAQDIYTYTPPLTSASSLQRDIAASLTQAWWAHQIAGNVATVTVGASAQQFVQLPPGVVLPSSSVNWFAPGGTYATMAMTGSRVAYEFICGFPTVPPYAMSRGWNYAGVSFAITSAAGDVQNFAAWQNTYNTSSAGGACGQVKGFRLTSWTFPSGVAINLTYGGGYDPTGDSGNIQALLNVSNSLGRRINFTTDGLGTLTGFDNNLSGGDLRHVTLTPGTSLPGSQLYEYSAMTDPAGAVTHHTYLVPFATSTTQRPVPFDLLSQVFTADNAVSPNLQYDYDALGRVKQVRDAINLQVGGRNPWTFFIADGTRGERDDPLGGTYSVTYDIFSHPWRYIDEDGRETDATSDGRGRVTSYTYPLSDQELFTYDVRNNTLSLTRVPKTGSLLANIVLQRSYVEAIGVAACTHPASCNKPLTDTSANGNVTNYTSDITTGLPSQILLPADTTGARPQTDYAYTSFGAGFYLLTQTTSKIDATHNQVTAYAYNASNDYVPLTTTVDPSGLALATGFTFDPQGSITEINGPRTDVTDVTDFTWDLDRRNIFAIQADPDAGGVNPRPTTKNTYDAVGRVTIVDTGTSISATGGSFSSTLTVTTAYDPAGNKIKVTTPTSVTQFSYDGDNRVLCTAGRMNPAVFGSLPDACTLGTAGSLGPDRISQNVYDGAGQVLQEIRALGVPLLQQTYATNTWTLNGKLASVYDANGSSHLTKYTYDGFDRLVTTEFADSTVLVPDIEQVTLYDPDGNVKTRINRSGQTFTMTYDNLDRVLTKLVPAAGTVPANTVTTAYDLLNKVTIVTDTNANAVTDCYDVAGRRTSETQSTTSVVATCGTPLNTATTRTVTSAFDQASNRSRLTWPDGYYADYTYDALNHPVTVIDSGGTTLATYSYDPLARRSKVQYNGTTGANMQYAWSPENDLNSLTNDFTGTANDVTFANSFSPAHQWTTGSISNGVFRYAPAFTATTTFAANTLNQYTTLNGTLAVGYDTRGNYAGAAAAPSFFYDAENRLMTAGPTKTYTYDPMGRRTSKTISSVTTNFLHDGDSEIADYDGTGTLTRRFVPGAAIDEYVAMVTAAGTKTFFHMDKMGSVVGMSDLSGALIEGPYTYDPYGLCYLGATSCILLSATTEPFRYTGQRFDAENTVYYYRARIYSPALGRFLQTDGVGYKDDLNLYTYVHNDPTDLTDPMGLAANTCSRTGSVDCSGTYGGDDKRLSTAVTINDGRRLAEQAAPPPNPDAVLMSKTHGKGERSWEGKSPNNRKGWRFDKKTGKYQQKGQNGNWVNKPIGPDGRPYDSNGNPLPGPVEVPSGAGKAKTVVAATLAGAAVGIAIEIGEGLAAVAAYLAASVLD